MPTASAANRGALSSTDWSTFNGKQAALVSGTNIKTVGGVSLLGSGDVGTIGTGYGGTGLTSFTNKGVVYASSTSALTTGSALAFDGTSLGIGTASPTARLTVQHARNTSAIVGFTITDGFNSSISMQAGYGNTAKSMLYTGAGEALLLGTADTERVRIFASGGVSIGNTTDPGATNLSVTGTGKFGTTVGVGAATPSASGAGITFPATQSASSDANTLDDYEEGDVTLGATTTLTAASGTITINTGTSFVRYTKVGRQVTVTGKLVVSSVSSPTNNLAINGLPFNSASNNFSAVSIYSYGYAASMTTTVIGSMDGGTASLTLQKTNSLGSVAVLAPDVQAGTNIYFSVTYFSA